MDKLKKLMITSTPRRHGKSMTNIVFNNGAVISFRKGYNFRQEADKYTVIVDEYNNIDKPSKYSNFLDKLQSITTDEE